MDKVEFLILRNLIHNEEYVRKVLPFIKPEYFELGNQIVIFQEIQKFIEEYNKPVTKEVLCIEIENRTDINDESFKNIVELWPFNDSVCFFHSQNVDVEDIKFKPSNVLETK